MVRYVVRKLDFGCLYKIKNKVLYLNSAYRLIRFKNRLNLNLKKKFKFNFKENKKTINFRYLKSFGLNSIFFNLTLKFKQIEFNKFANLSHISFNTYFLQKKKNKIKNFLKQKKNLNFIKKKVFLIKKFLKYKTKLLIKHFHILNKFMKKIQNTPFKGFDFLKKKIRMQIRKRFKFRNKFRLKKVFQYKYNLKFLFKDTTQYKAELRKQKILKDKLELEEKLKFEKERKTNYKLFLQYVKMEELEKKRKQQAKNRKKKPRFKILLSQVFKKTKNIRKFRRIKLAVNYFLNKCKNYILNTFQFNILNYIYFNKLKINIKKIKFTKKILKKKFLKLSKDLSKKYIFMSVSRRKIKIKYYFSKISIILNKFIKNVSNIQKSKFNFYIKLENFDRYSKLYNKSNLIKFFFNFIFFFFFKFFNINTVLKNSRKKKKDFKFNRDFFSLNRLMKKNKINHIFETQNSFFFFRFIRLSKKLLDLVTPIKKNIIINQNIVKINQNIKCNYHLILLNFLKLNLFFKDFKISFFINKVLLNLFFLIVCNMSNKHKNLIINYI